MSDYGEDDFSDVGDYFYVEDEYTPADDLAEHAINSPPPTAYAEDDGEDWDRFDYFNDLEYGSDGYEDDSFKARGLKTEQTGQKRKRGTANSHSKKKRRVEKENTVSSSSSSKPLYPPIVWRSQVNREVKPKQLDENAEPYALLKDWRERLADTPAWTANTPQASSPKKKASRKGKATRISQPLPPIVNNEDEFEDEGEGEGEGDVGIDPTVLMEALQKNLAAAGGPLNGMDPQQLLQFAMRMMNNQDAGDEIAGELAEDILMQGEDDEEEGDGEAPADLVDWLSKQKGPAHNAPSGQNEVPNTGIPKAPEVGHTSQSPPTPPSSDVNRSHRGKEHSKTDDGAPSQEDGTTPNTAPDNLNRKRKAEEDANIVDSKTASKKRVTRSYHAPTASSQAKAVPTTRAKSGRTKR